MSETTQKFVGDPDAIDGIPCFLDENDLKEQQVAAKKHYDETAWQKYDAAMDWQFAAVCEDEEIVRAGMLDSLNLKPGDSVLEVGCGTGRDSWRLAQAVGETGEFYVQDLSLNMVKMCRERFERDHPNLLDRTTFFVSDGGKLPFADNSFNAFFHFGGFNLFGDLKSAALEFARVVKPGGVVLLGDEGVAPWLRGTDFEEIVVENNPLFKNTIPLDTLPESARNVNVRWIMGNCFYLMQFTKGDDGPPPLNLDLKHKGARGGSMRTRHFGKLEGVSEETKKLAWEAIAKRGGSMHEWLDELVRREAESELADK